MITKIARFFVSLLMLISPSLPHLLALPEIPSGRELNLEERFVLEWEDEFLGDKLDTSKWDDNQSVDTLHWGPIRKGGYWHKDMISVRDGNLIITTQYKNEPLEGNTFGSPDNYGVGYYTGMIATAGKAEFKYGYFECRAILPKASGMWSAFWMMNGDVYETENLGHDGAEIDVFESMYYKNRFFGTGDAILCGIHYDGYGEAHKYDRLGEYFADDPYEQFNTYGVEWNENECIFYINGIETGRITGDAVSHNPEYLILSCEVAGDNAVPDNKEISLKGDECAEFIVDYVRVYSYR